MSQIRQFMTESPHAIGQDQTLKFAHDRMQQFGLRAIPVLDGGVLVGVVSERDIALVGAVSPSQLETILVEEAMAAETYAVAAADDIAAVTAHMVQHKYANAVVMEHNKVIGMFTSSDALRLLSGLLAQTGRAAELEKLAVRTTSPSSTGKK